MVTAVGFEFLVRRKCGRDGRVKRGDIDKEEDDENEVGELYFLLEKKVPKFDQVESASTPYTKII